LLGRRLYGRYLSRKSPELEQRLKEVKHRKFDREYKELRAMKRDELKKRYYARDTEGTKGE